MPKIQINGVGLNYRSVGQGPDVILVHGLAANLAFWRLAAMRLLASHYRVTVFDLRGHGYSDMPPSGYTDADLAGDLKGLVEALGITSAHLVGHSYGGAVVLRYALDNPGKVASLTVVDTRLPSLQPTLRKSEFPQWELYRQRFQEAGFDVKGEEDLDFEMLEAFDDPRWRELRRSVGGARFFVPFEGLNGGQRGIKRWREMLETTTAREDLRQYRGPGPAAVTGLRFPAMAFYGEYSHCMASGRGIVERVPECRLAVCAEGGHFFPFVHPQRFAETVQGFIDDAERAARQTAAARQAAGATLLPVVAGAPPVSTGTAARSLSASGVGEES